MTVAQNNIKQHLISKLTQMIICKRGFAFVDAYKFLLNSMTYKRLSRETYLLEQGDLFLYGLLEKEITSESQG